MGEPHLVHASTLTLRPALPRGQCGAARTVRRSAATSGRPTTKRRIARCCRRQPPQPRAARRLRRRAALDRRAPAGDPRAARGPPRSPRRGRALRARAGGGRGRQLSRSASVHALASGVTRAEVEQACERLVVRDLLVRGRRPGALRFHHALIRDVAYAALAKSVRAGLHERHAAWLHDLGSRLAEADARIGFHLETACRLTRRDRRRRPGRARGAGGRAARGGGATRRTRAATWPARSASSTAPSRCWATTIRAGAALLPGLVSALFESGASDRAEHARRPRRPRDRSARAGARARPRARSSASTSGSPAIPRRSRRSARRRSSPRRPRRCCALGDELGLARAAYSMSDLAWLAGDAVASYAPRRGSC